MLTQNMAAKLTLMESEDISYAAAGRVLAGITTVKIERERKEKHERTKS